MNCSGKKMSHPAKSYSELDLRIEFSFNSTLALYKNFANFVQQVFNAKYVLTN
jgi:hypothetical protein